MSTSVSEQCRSCLIVLPDIILNLSQPEHSNDRVKYAVSEELDRFRLFVGNIGALHKPESSMSVESRLIEAKDVLTYFLNLLADLNEAVADLLDIVSGKREGMVSIGDEAEDDHAKEISEVDELLEEISGTITRLFKVSILIRQAAPTDLFAKALSRDRYRFDDRFDIAHVGEKYHKLSINDYAWLRQRLGRAITQRRHYLSYVQDHHEKLECSPNSYDEVDDSAFRFEIPIIKQPQDSKQTLDTASRPSFFTKATTVVPERITPQLLTAADSDSEEDARTCTTISRSIDGDPESSNTVRIPKLEHLRFGNTKEIECPFCFRIKKFKSERTWRRHVFSDIRPYVCTFANCNAPYFGDINEWFQHEMKFHRVEYQCLICPERIFSRENKYLSHLRREHADILHDDNELLGRDLAKRPLTQIPASDCPCCFDWADRLRKSIRTSEPSLNDVITVVPTVFKRHLAGHLEQLALFAIPVGAATCDDNTSNVAIMENESKQTDVSRLSTLSFPSSRENQDKLSLDTEGDMNKIESLPNDFQVAQARGPRKGLSFEQRTNARLMRIIGVCVNCQKKRQRCDPNTPCGPCREDHKGESAGSPCRDRLLSDRCSDFLSKRWHPTARPLDSFLTPGIYHVIPDITYSIPVIFGFGPSLTLPVHKVRIENNETHIHEHTVCAWPPSNTTFQQTNAVLPAVLTPDSMFDLANTLDGHLSELVYSDFRHFPLFCSPLRILRDINTFFRALAATKSRHNQTLLQALKLLVLVHVGSDITVPSPASNPVLSQLAEETIGRTEGHMPEPTPCFIRSQFAEVIPSLALALCKEVLFGLEILLRDPNGDGENGPIALALMMVVLMAIESTQYHAARLPYHNSYDIPKVSPSSSDDEVDDTSAQALLAAYSACFSSYHNRLELRLQGVNLPLESVPTSPVAAFEQNVQVLTRKTNNAGYLSRKATEKRMGDDMEYFFDRLVAQILLLKPGDYQLQDQSV
jgi:hypothetical protein